MENDPCGFPGCVRLGPGFGSALLAAGLAGVDMLSSRDLGEPVTDRRTSWVRRTQIGLTTVYIKTYDYPTTHDRVRGAFRTTWLAASRARREWGALEWLREHGFGGPRPVALAEHRRCGVLRRAVLVTEAFPGQPLSTLLSKLSESTRDEVLRELERYTEAIHAAGFRDRNLDLRNLLARQREDRSWQIVKIDSPRHRLLVAGPATDRLAAADWDRLAGSLTAAGY